MGSSSRPSVWLTPCPTSSSTKDSQQRPSMVIALNASVSVHWNSSAMVDARSWLQPQLPLEGWTSRTSLTWSITIFLPTLTTTFTASGVPVVLETPVYRLLSSTVATVALSVISLNSSRKLTRKSPVSWRTLLARAPASVEVVEVVVVAVLVAVLLLLVTCVVRAVAWAVLPHMAAALADLVAMAVVAAVTVGLRHGELPAVVGHTAAAAVVVVAADMVEAMATQAVPAVHHLGGKRPSPLHHWANEISLCFSMVFPNFFDTCTLGRVTGWLKSDK